MFKPSKNTDEFVTVPTNSASVVCFATLKLEGQLLTSKLLSCLHGNQWVSNVRTVCKLSHVNYKYLFLVPGIMIEFYALSLKFSQSAVIVFCG